MAKRRAAKSRSRRPAPSRRRAVASRPTSIDDLAAVVARGGDELLQVDDRLDAESWASRMFGTFYKLDAPLDARDAIDRDLVPAVLRAAELVMR